MPWAFAFDDGAVHDPAICRNALDNSLPITGGRNCPGRDRPLGDGIDFSVFADGGVTSKVPKILGIADSGNGDINAAALFGEGKVAVTITATTLAVSRLS